MFGRKKIAMVVAEFLGTFSLVCAVLLMARQINLTFFPAVVAGGTLGLMVLTIGAISGAHINPAVTVGMWTLRKIETTRAIVYVAAQLLGGVVAWRFAEYLLDSPLKDVGGDKLDWRVLTAEAVGTLIFTFGVAAAVYQGYRGLRQAVAIGGSLTLGILVAGFASNGLLNPAVALGVNSLNFAYVAGPLLGAIIGMNLYALLFAPTLDGVQVINRATTTKSSKSTKKKRTINKHK